VKCGEYDAAVYERITGPTLAEEMLRTPDKLDELMRRFAELGQKIHNADAPSDIFPTIMKDLQNPRVHEMMRLWFDEQELEKWERLFALIPKRETMLHTDFQYSNVMIQNGEFILIDVGGACYGHPVMEFTGTYIWAYHPEIIRMPFPDGMCKKAFDLYVKYYFGDRLTEENRPLVYDLFEFSGMLMIATMYALKEAAAGKEHLSEEKRTKIHAMFAPLFARDPDDIRKKFETADKELFVRSAPEKGHV
jgi:aminoglycoside phosphotransferase (APT) family kinase protein